MDYTQEAIRALGTSIEASEAAEILSSYYTGAVAAISAASDKDSARRSRDEIKKARIWEAIQELKTRKGEIISRPSTQFNALIKYVGILVSQNVKLLGEAEVKYRAASSLQSDIVDASLDFGGKLVDTISSVGTGVKNTLESTLTLTGMLGKILPVLVFAAAGLVVYLYGRNLGLFKK